MNKIAVETTIKVWANRKGCEHIEFTKLKCTSNQVADIDSLITNSQKGDNVLLSIEPVQKKLQIPAITSPIKVTGIDCRKSGKKLIVTGFKSPDDRAEIMKRLTDVGTPILVTIEDKQTKIPVDEQKTFEQADKQLPSEKDVEYEIDGSGLITNPSEIYVNIPKKLGAECTVFFGCDELDKFYVGYEIKVGRRSGGYSYYKPINTVNNAYDSLKDALEAAKEEICDWIDSKENYKNKTALKTKIIKTLEAYV